jgi:hypothetical protein
MQIAVASCAGALAVERELFPEEEDLGEQADFRTDKA